MIKILGNIPRNINIACSGGIDSMVAVDFLKRNHGITLLFFNHGTDASKEAENFLKKYSENNNIPIVIGNISNYEKDKRESQEEFWRRCRYDFFKNNSLDKAVVTCHHLDDVLETWVFTSAHGNPKTIPYERKDINVIRPFLINRKDEFVKWAAKYNVKYVEDKSNNDLKYKRNFIRHSVVPEYVKINSGIYTVLKKKYNVLEERTM